MLLAFPFLVNAADWQPRIDKDGIQVYTRPVEGSKFLEFKAVMEVAGSVKSCLAVMDDIDAYIEWVPNLKEMRLLEKTSRADMTLYQCIGAPWPVSPRDSVFSVTTKEDTATQTVVITFVSKPDLLPEVKGIVRVKKINAQWIMVTDEKKGTLSITYIQHSEPEGTLPTWVANAYVTQRPYKMLSNLREIMKKPKYSGSVTQ